MKNLHFTRLIKLSLIGIFILASLVIVFNLVKNASRRSRISDDSGEILVDTIARQESIQHLEITKGLKENFRISADQHYQGEDGRFYLEGNIQIISVKKGEGEDIVITGQKAAYDQELTNFEITEDVRIIFRDLEILAPVLRFDTDAQTFVADKEVRFHSPRLEGQAKKLMFWLKDKRISLQRGVTVTLHHGLGSSHPLGIKARRFDYHRNDRKGYFTGDVVLSHGKSSAAAERVEVELYFNEEKAKSFLLKGQVTAVFRDEGEGFKTPSRRVFPLYQDTQKVEADELSIQIFQKHPHVKKVRARGNSRIDFLSGDKARTRIRAQMIEFQMTTKGELRSFMAEERASIQETGENGEQRTLSGHVLYLTKKKNALVSQGRKDSLSRLKSGEAEIMAGEISLALKRYGIKAKRAVKAILDPSGMKRTVGFFSQESPVFITAETMERTKRKQRFQFDNDVKVWQAAESLATQSLVLYKKSGRVECEKDVRAVFLLSSEGKEDRKVEMSSERMVFNPKKKILLFDTEAVLKADEFSIKAKTVIMRFSQEGQTVSSVTAKQDVVVLQPGREGRGGLAEFDVKNERIVLSGEPVVEDEERGVLRGDKLTFDLAGDRIVVENLGRERSKTVIKS